LKILLFSNGFYPALGGIESISETLADDFVREGHDVCLITRTKGNGVKRFSYPIYRLPSIVVVIKMIFWADVVFENNPCLRMSWPLYFLKKAHVTALQTWIGHPDKSKTIIERLKIKLVKRSSRVIACSDAIRKNIIPYATTVGNPYDDVVFKRIHSISKQKDFVFLGRLVSDKGADLAIKAFEILSSEYLDKSLTLTVIGEGDEEVKLRGLAAQSRFSKNIFFKGSLKGKQLCETLNEHRYLLIPSIWKEPFGIVALEGMACECIPIVSAGGGLPDAVGLAGLVFERGSVADLVEKMRIVLNEENVRQVLLDSATSQLSNHKSLTVSRIYLSMFQQSLNDLKL